MNLCVMNPDELIKYKTTWRPSKLARGCRRSDVVENVRALVPEQGQEYLDGAFEGCPEAALHLSLSCHDFQRGWLAGRMYLARVAPVAFRVVLEHSITQSRCYMKVFQASKGMLGIERWCRYAGFPVPNGLPDKVVVYRGAQGSSLREAIRSPFWTLERSIADGFATRWPGESGLVVEASIPRESIFFYSNCRNEEEVMFLDWLGWFDSDDIVAMHSIAGAEGLSGGTA